MPEHPCGIHDLVYTAMRPGCPACAAERRAEALLTERDALQRQLDTQRIELEKVRAISDLSYSMKSAASMLDDNDRAFLKGVMYRWREKKDVDLAVVSGRTFVDNEGDHVCTSVGGLGLAGFFQEAIQSYGKPTAMNMLLRGMAQHLGG